MEISDLLEDLFGVVPSLLFVACVPLEISDLLLDLFGVILSPILVVQGVVGGGLSTPWWA